jgi:hypothetical protein
VTDSGDDGIPAAESRDLSAGERAGPQAPLPGQDGPRHRPQKPRRRRSGWRALVAALLIVAGCVLAPLSVVAVWTANQVSDTSRYVANVEPLIKDPAIQNALTDKITNQIVTRINVPALTDQAAAVLAQKGLPRISTLLRGVSGSLASGVAGFVHSRIHKIITGPRMANAWVQVNRVASQQLIAVLSGRATSGSGAVGVSNGQVTLDLAPLIAVAKQDLVARGLTIAGKIPIVHVTFALFPSKNLAKAQKAYRLIYDLKIVLPIGTLVLLGLGVLTARRRRRALIGAGLGLAGSMLVLGAALLIARTIYLNSVPASASADAAAAAFDILVRFIKTALRALLVAGLIVAAGAFFTGPSVTAVRTRSALSSGLGRLRHGGESGPAGQWTYAHRKALRIGAVALAALVFVFWGQPTAAVVVAIAILLLIVLGLIELIGRPPTQPSPAPHAPDG